MIPWVHWLIETPLAHYSIMGVNALVVPGMKIEIAAYVLAPQTR